jgi:mRNA interferase RelE/StbE
MISIEWSNKARKQVSKLPVDVQGKVLAFVDALKENPIPPGIKKLKGYDNIYRKRLGDYRVVWEVMENRLVVLVLKVGQRQGIYQ